MSLPICDHCGHPVTPDNNAQILSVLAHITPLEQARHLQPMEDEGVPICPGSPSRFQYLDGSARDERPSAKYLPALEAPIRAAYEEMRRQADLILST